MPSEVVFKKSFFILGRTHAMSDESLIAVFVDFENLALGVRDMKGGSVRIELLLA